MARSNPQRHRLPFYITIDLRHTARHRSPTQTRTAKTPMYHLTPMPLHEHRLTNRSQVHMCKSTRDKKNMSPEAKRQLHTKAHKSVKGDTLIHCFA